MDPINPRDWLAEMLEASDSRWRRVEIPDECEPEESPSQTSASMRACGFCGILGYVSVCDDCVSMFAKPLGAWHNRVAGLYRATYDKYQCSELYNFGGNWIADVWDALWDAHIDTL